MKDRWMDAYDRRARLQPALLAALPLALSVVPLVQGIVAWWTVTAPLIVYCGGAYLLAQLVRDRGKRIQVHLWRQWGGAPTTRLLRHRDAANPVLVARRHRRLAQLVPNITFPSAADEAADPEGADNVYEASVKYLLDATRDNALLFNENCNYGFRRNLLGLKEWGIGSALLGLLLVVSAAAMRIESGLSTAAIAALFIDVAALCFWIIVVRPSWVRIAADDYAERLFGAADQVSSEVSAAAR